MKRLSVLVTPATLLAGLVLFVPGDTVISIADTRIPNDEVASSESNNGSATASICITMTGVLSE